MARRAVLLSTDVRPQVFIARRLPDPGVDLIREVAEVDMWTENLPPPREELFRRIAGCAGVVLYPSERVDDGRPEPPRGGVVLGRV